MGNQVHANGMDIADLSDGDIVTVRFDPPVKDSEVGDISEATGTVRRIVSHVFLLADSHRKAWSMPACLDLKEGSVAGIRLECRAADRAAEKARAARGEIVFEEPPASSEELQAQLSDLAEMICHETDGRAFRGRKGQLVKQFEDIADLVSLARTKRNYLLTRARIGCDFHPWETKDDRVYRINTVRPLPSDFAMEAKARRDLAQRLEESIRIFGEAEREARNLASYLRNKGYDVRRPHPNAQALYICVRSGKMKADLMVAPSLNGLWTASARPPDNKTKARALRRITREGHLLKLTDDLKDYLTSITIDAI